MENKEKKEDIIQDQEKLEDEDVLEETKEEAKEDSQVDEKNREIQELNNRLLRLQADFINYKNRVEREKTSLYANATEEVILQILPVLDNFEIALKNMESDKAYYEGVKMIYDQLVGVLTKNGLKEIECEGKAFDPNFHHAVLTEEVEGKEEGTVLEALQKGYMLNDKVIRPSMVKVAK